MADIGRTKPHLRRFAGRVLVGHDEYAGYWACAMRGLKGIGYGYNPLDAYKDWDRWIYLPQLGHKFKRAE